MFYFRAPNPACLISLVNPFNSVVSFFFIVFYNNDNYTLHERKTVIHLVLARFNSTVSFLPYLYVEMNKVGKKMRVLF